MAEIVGNEIVYDKLEDVLPSLTKMSNEQLLKLSDICSIANDFYKNNKMSHNKELHEFAWITIKTHLKVRDTDLRCEYFDLFKQEAPEFASLLDYEKLQEAIFRTIKG